MVPRAGLGVLATLLVLGLGMPTAHAAGPEDKGWHGEVMPYFWGVGIDGKLRVDDQTTHVHYSLSDVIDSLDW